MVLLINKGTYVTRLDLLYLRSRLVFLVSSAHFPSNNINF